MTYVSLVMAIAGTGRLGGWCWPVDDVCVGQRRELARRDDCRTVRKWWDLPDGHSRLAGDVGFAGQSWRRNSGPGKGCSPGWLSVWRAAGPLSLFGMGDGSADLADIADRIMGNKRE